MDVGENLFIAAVLEFNSISSVESAAIIDSSLTDVTASVERRGKEIPNGVARHLKSLSFT